MEVLLASESGGHGSYVKKGRNRRGSIEWKISEASRGQFRGLLHKEASKEGRTVIEQRFLVSQNQEKPTK